MSADTGYKVALSDLFPSAVPESDVSKKLLARSSNGLDIAPML
jgi:hypothetical protein